MGTIRIWQVSDTHLSAERPFFQANWDAFASAVAGARPDLVVHTGDLALEGAEREGDVAAGHAALALLDVPWCAIPGNHDIGDNDAPGYRPKHPVSHALLARWHERFGECHWVRDLGAWRIVGLNAELLGDNPEPALCDHAVAQWAFLDQALATGRPVLLFIHKPLFQDHPDQSAEPALRYVPPAAAARLRAAIEASTARIVASGHVHQHRQLDVAGIRFVWAPATAFVLPDTAQARIGEKSLGYVAYTLQDDGGFTVTVETPVSFAPNDISDFPDAYPKSAKVAADAG